MALTKCTECGKDISDAAAVCPTCGVKVPKKTKALTWIAGGVVALVMFSCINGLEKSKDELQVSQAKKAAIEAAKSPAQKASEAAKAVHSEREYRFGVVATKLVKAGLQNPASFEFVNASVVDNGALCLTYRATNGFNAVVTENIAVTRKLSKGVWNKDCAGHDAKDMQHIKRALG